MLSRAVRAALTIAFAGCLLGPGTGCASESPSSTGSLESSGNDGPDTSPANTDRRQVSEWEEIRRLSEPYWSKDEPRAKRGIDGRGTVRKGSAGGTSKGETATKSPSDAQAGDPDDPLVVVDQHHGLPPDYEPENMVFLQPLDVPTLGGGTMKLREKAAKAASRMIEDARKDDIELVVSSAYRSYDAQVVSYGRLKAIYGEQAKSFSAPPGHSEHQLGTVIDVSNSETNYRLVQSFGETGASEWLDRNAASYGFVLSYPAEAEENTGYHWEPWHYRYVGERNAQRYESADYDNPQRYFLERGVVPEGA